MNKHTIVQFVCALVIASTVHAADWIVPAEREGDWRVGVSVGVAGGIDQYRPGGANARTTLIDVTQAPYNADNTGATDCAAAINSAIAAATAGQVVYLPAGTYRVNSAVSVGYKDDITIRGDGSSLTTVKAYGTSAVFLLGGSADYLWNYPLTTISSALTKGQTVIPLSNTTGLSAGQLVALRISDDPYSRDYPVFHTSAYETSRAFRTRISSVAANTSITVFPPLPMALAAGSARVARATSSAQNVGVEGIYFDCEENTNSDPVQVKQAWNSWLYDVKITHSPNRLLTFTYNSACEIRKCWISTRQSSGSNGAGILFDFNSNCWIEDSVIAEISALIQANSGSLNNVISYNYGHDSILSGVSGPGFKDAHAPHQQWNLYEGNIGPNFQSDGRAGSSSHGMLFRNWFHGSNPGLSDSWTLSLNRFCRYYSLVGNVLGTDAGNNGAYSFGNPNQGNGSYSGTATMIGWEGTLSSRTDANTGTATLPNHAAWANPAVSVSHTIATGQVVDVWWDGGERTGVTVGTVSGTSVPLDGGSGDDFPAQDTAIHVRDWHRDMGQYGYGLMATLTTRSTNTSGVFTLVWNSGTITTGTRDFAITSDDGSSYVVRGVEVLSVDGAAMTFGNGSYGNTPSGTLPAEGASLIIWPEVSGYQEMDLDVEKTTLLADNHLTSIAGIPAAEDTADTLPASLIHASKPAWFGVLSWPAINPESPSFALDAIPAGYRFYNDEDPPTEGALTGPTAPNTATLTAIRNIGATISWTDASDNETSFEIDRSTDNSTWAQVASVSANSTSYEERNLPPGTTYYYRVRAVNGAGDSANATPTPSSITTGAPAPVRRSKNGGAVRTGGI